MVISNVEGPVATAPTEPPLPRRSLRHRIDRFPLVVFLGLLVVFAMLVIPPLVALVRIAFTDSKTGTFTFDNFLSILPNLTRADLLSNTVIFAISTTAISFVVGSLLA